MSFLGKKNQNAFTGDGYYDTDPLTTAQDLTRLTHPPPLRIPPPAALS